ncbi:MAG: glycosyltransferase family 2 protein [Patescibacteria group bacterium]|nr:glycosyltransferase family 2 protein [Patescibacteria group bacterium]
MADKLKFSIIIPSYNEGDDIRLSIESAINQTYQNKEILVVDDSNDNTPKIIKEYENSDVLFLNGPRRGCCGARNFGMKEARGDIVVLLNGDVVLPPDFLEKILRHYNNGADYVLVESRGFNLENLWARFVEMQHRYEMKKIGETAEWTEGFSCRRQAALDIGLIPGDFSARFCRDWFLGKKLKEAGFKKKVDFSILVTHKSPDNFKEYWRVRKNRGKFSALTQCFLLRHNRGFLTLKFLFKNLLRLLEFVLIFLAAIKIYKISKFSEKPAKNFLPFLFAYFIQKIAFVYGEWSGLIFKK